MSARETEVTLTVLVPMFNEAQTIRKILHRLLAVDAGCPMEIFVVDDGSSDESSHIASDAVGDASSRIQVLTRPHNGGKGAALATVLARASATYVAVLDADLELLPEDLPILVRPLIEGTADAVIGVSRRHPSCGVRKRAARFPYEVPNSVITLSFSVRNCSWIKDVMSGYKILPPKYD